ncbi:MAG: GntR family transcriptional regulator, partial [Acidobacteria bacterium]|nr:GntR family transcriptional regulator [Acidobacteriota bacterium]
SERELAKIHGVSLMTARHGLADLEREGMVERRRGSGTFVAPPKIHFNKLMSFTEQLATRGLISCSKVLSCSVVDNEPDISARLASPSGSRLLKVERLRLGSDEPFALETAYLPARHFPGLNRGRLERGSLFSILDREYGVTLAHADEEVDATSADTKAADLLSVVRGAPLLRIRQVIFSANGQPTLYGLGLYRSDRHTLLIRRFR